MVQDKFYQLQKAQIKLNGIFDEKINLIIKGIFKKIDAKLLADYFRNTMDQFAVGEFWGKILRAACFIYKYNQDAELLEYIQNAVDDMLNIQDEDGCISTVPKALQPNGTSGSDLWERKYVLLGLLGAYEVTGRQDVLDGMLRMAKYTAAQVGDVPKKPVTQTGWAFCGIESTSILEPIVKIYLLTKDKELLEFADYLVKSGGCSRENMFLGILNGKSPKNIGSTGIAEESIAKAYEMMSCFEGMVEYYRATGEKWTLKAAEKLYDKLIEEEITLLGSGGANGPYNKGPGEGEQWNFTRFEQTNPDLTLMMETCVTVTWMKLCYQLLRITGESKYAEQIEKSGYNLLIGALRPDGQFFEYFPKFNGNRNRTVNFSYNINGFDLSCCTANGPMGMALMPFTCYMQAKDGLVLNIFENGTVSNEETELEIKSEYPAVGKVDIEIKKLPQAGTKLYIRIPTFAKNFEISTDNAKTDYSEERGYAAVSISRLCRVRISFDMELVMHEAPKGTNRAGDNFVAFTYGPLVMARDVVFGEDPLEKLNYHTFTGEYKKISFDTAFAAFETEISGKPIRLLDYASAGREWNTEGKTEFAVWLPY